jgi:hypothetical protein
MMMGARLNKRLNYTIFRSALEAIDRANQKLNEFDEEKLTAKIVEKILNLAARERQRWRKDGRSPHSVTEFSQAGRTKVQIATYPAKPYYFSLPGRIR